MRNSLLITSGLVVVLMSSPVLAQTAPTEDGARAGGLNEIIVTAERRSSSVQDTSIAITVVDGDEIEAIVNRPEELTTFSTSLNVAPSGGMTQLYIRGVGNLGGTSFAEGAVGFNVDQVYVGRPTALDAVFFDLERVEVLKGPQGTLYGRNATGGAINVITKKPELDTFEISANGDVGNYSLIRMAGTINLPFSDTVGIRLAGQHISHDGYLSDGYNDQDTDALRGHVYFEPSDSVSLLVTAEYAHLGGQADGFVPSFRTCGDFCGPSEPENRALELVGFFANRLTAPNDEGIGFQDNTFWSVTGDLEVSLGFANLTVIPSHRSAKIDTLIYPSLFRGRVKDKSNQDSIEVRLASQGDNRLNWLLGAYFYDEDVAGDYAYGHGSVTSQRNTPDISNKSLAFFGQADVNLTDDFRLIGGLRYTKDKKSLSGLNECTGGIFCIGQEDIFLSAKDSWEDVSYKVGMEWDAGPDSMLYANYSTGFKSGGFFPAALDAEFDPETLNAWAVGAKNQFLDNRVMLNIEAFWWDYKDHQESHLGTACVAETDGACTRFANVFLTENVGKAKIKGIELDAAWAISPNDRLNFSVAYLDAVATSFSYNQPASAPPNSAIQCDTVNQGSFFVVDCSGKQMPRSPKWTGRVAYEHIFPLNNGAEIVAEASTYFSSKYWASIDFVPGTDQKSYTRSSASITYTAPEGLWSIGAWVRNIEDEPVAGSAGVKVFANTPGVQLRAPRTFGVSFSAKYGQPR